MKLAMAMVLGFAGALAAQNPPAGEQPQQALPLRPAPRQLGQDRAQLLRQQVEERFGRMVQMELQLDSRQMDRLRQTMRANQDRRRDLIRREADVRRAIGEQLQPGVAANQDSLNRLLSAVAQLRTQRAQADEQFLRELAFLTPVQRARLMMMTQRFEEQMRQVRERMRPEEEGPPMGPGMAPGVGPGRQPVPMRPGGGRPGGQRPGRPF